MEAAWPLLALRGCRISLRSGPEKCDVDIKPPRTPPHKRAERGRGRLGGDGVTPQHSVYNSAYIYWALTHPFSAVRVVAVVRRRAQDGAIDPKNGVWSMVRRLCGYVAGRKRGTEGAKVPGVAP